MADRDDKDLSGAAKMNRRGLLKCMGWGGHRRRLDFERRRAANARLDRRSFRGGG
jgi:hypothetical protein